MVMVIANLLLKSRHYLELGNRAYRIKLSIVLPFFLIAGAFAPKKIYCSMYRILRKIEVDRYLEIPFNDRLDNKFSKFKAQIEESVKYLSVDPIHRIYSAMPSTRPVES
jgi:hypothetical protein